MLFSVRNLHKANWKLFLREICSLWGVTPADSRRRMSFLWNSTTDSRQLFLRAVAIHFSTISNFCLNSGDTALSRNTRLWTSDDLSKQRKKYLIFVYPDYRRWASHYYRLGIGNQSGMSPGASFAAPPSESLRSACCRCPSPRSPGGWRRWSPRSSSCPRSPWSCSGSTSDWKSFR